MGKQNGCNFVSGNLKKIHHILRCCLRVSQDVFRLLQHLRQIVTLVHPQRCKLAKKSEWNQIMHGDNGPTSSQQGCFWNRREQQRGLQLAVNAGHLPLSPDQTRKMPFASLLMGESCRGGVTDEILSLRGNQKSRIKVFEIGQQVNRVGCQSGGFLWQKRQIDRDWTYQNDSLAPCNSTHP